ncbi:AlpA family transcriptional regulator [Pseudorhodoferax sp. Leaf267]|uniref:helix-turn-helix transcriptional regulator n=1 Tax=Pseudorhodoferax sp. Leaf267 TaxID=1736316 RepID=UPI001F2886C0|nr:AlpA family phage regulatory protein [Pseudorhodoferax sp. Leaf267]
MIGARSEGCAMITMLRMSAVVAHTGRSRTSIYRDVEDGLFTKPVRIGTGAIGWPDYEVASLIAARVADKSEDEVRALVADLHEKRRTALDEAKLHGH